MLNTSPRQIALVAGAGSAALLAAALFYQWRGFPPCDLCILQRWPHLVAAVISALIWLTGFRRSLAVPGLLAALTATGFAAFHAGVELQFWTGPQHCSAAVSNLTQMSSGDLLSALKSAPITRCDAVTWSVMGISMAGWNAICSILLSGLWAWSLRQKQTR